MLCKLHVLFPSLRLVVLYPNLKVTVSEVLDSACLEKGKAMTWSNEDHHLNTP